MIMNSIIEQLTKGMIILNGLYFIKFSQYQGVVLTKVSVLMSVYKEREEWINESINSILNQSFKDFELIIILDNPDSLQHRRIVESFAESYPDKIKLLINEKNSGLPVSINRGMEIASGEYIARLDADDIAIPERFELQCEFLDKHPEIDLLGSAATAIDMDGNFIMELPVPSSHEEILKKSELGNPMIHPSWMMRKRVLNEIKYRNLPSAEDYDFLLRTIDKGFGIANIPKPLIKYRFNENGLSKSKEFHRRKCANLVLKLHKERVKHGREIGKIDKNTTEPTKYELWIGSIYFELSAKRSKVKNKPVKFLYSLLVVAASYMSAVTRGPMNRFFLSKLRERKAGVKATRSENHLRR